MTPQPLQVNQTSRDRKVVVEEAGLPKLSLISVLAGTVAAYGAFAIVAAITGAVLNALDVDTNFSTNDWSSTGAIGGLATGIALLIAYFFGGYVAGRMARRSGLLHGIAVAVLSVIGGGLAGALISWLADNDEVESNLRSIGVPTTWDDWEAVAVATAIVALAALIIGSIAGALYGERWHARLLRRAADPDRGPSAEARRRADEAAMERDRLVEREAWPAETRRDDVPQARDQDASGDVPQARDHDGSDDRDGERVPDHGREAPGNEEIDLRDDRGPRYTAAEWEAFQRASAQQRSDPRSTDQPHGADH